MMTMMDSFVERAPIYYVLLGLVTAAVMIVTTRVDKTDPPPAPWFECCVVLTVFWPILWVRLVRNALKR